MVKKVKNPGLTPIYVLDGELLTKRQFNYRKKKFLNSLSDEERKNFDLRLRAFTVLWRSFYDERTK